LELQELGVDDVNEAAVARYLADRTEHRRPQTGHRSTLKKLLAVLRQIDAIAPETPIEFGVAANGFLQTSPAIWLGSEAWSAPRSFVIGRWFDCFFRRYGFE